MNNQLPSPGRDDDANAPKDEDDRFMTLGFYVSLTLGFFVGFWTVCGTLMLNSSSELYLLDSKI